MKQFLYKYMILALLLSFFLLASCAGHGKLSVVPRNETDALVEDLLSNTDQYGVHYHGNSQKFVSGLLFDPIDNDRHIRPEGALWHEVTDAKAIAAMDGRFSIALEDIRKVAVPVLRHRVSTNFQAQAEGMSSEKIIERLVAEIPEPEVPKFAGGSTPPPPPG